jgi:phosphate-selective porin OprO/OprP
MAILRRSAATLVSSVLGLIWCLSAQAQDALPRLPPDGVPAAPGSPPPGTAAAGGSRESQLEDEVRQLKEMVRQLSTRVEELSAQTAQRNGLKPGESRSYSDPTPPGAPAENRNRTGEGGGGATRAGNQQGIGNRRLGEIKLDTFYNYNLQGFEFATEDEELTLKFRALAQADGKFFENSGQVPVSSGFTVPRSRLYFDGHLTRPIEYQISFQQSYDTFNILNLFLNFNYDKRLQFRMGRLKTPYTYEFYKINIWDLYTPERSLFNNNFGLNRQVGAMGWGMLFENRLEYAVGAFGGQRNSYVPYKNTPDVVAFLNFKPFEQAAPPAFWSFVRDFNIGGSVDWGNENNPLLPSTMRTSTTANSAGLASTSGVNDANVPFLNFNNNVTEKGARALWELHMAYFYKGLTLLGAWDAGFDSFAVTNQRPIAVPVNGYFVQAAYLITGETRTATGLIDPLRRFDLRRGRFGLGAFEPTARFSELSIGKQIFNGGFADPNLWTNQVYQVDAGVVWYLNRFVKVYFDWEYSMFGQPVYYSPGHFARNSSLFWMRLQAFF